MSTSNKDLIVRWFEEVWNQGRADAIDEMFHSEGIAHGLSDDIENPLKGPAAFKPFHASLREAFPDMTITVEDTISEGDKLAARCSVRAKHQGHGLGCAPTNEPVAFSGMTIVRIADGKIIEAWNNFDFMTMYQQVGLLPPRQS